MYEFIRGTLVSKDPTSAVIEAGGIGYRLNITTQTFDQLGKQDSEVKLLLHHTINSEQGEERLYAFLEAKERMLFRQLLDVQRVGPSVALRILSNAGTAPLIGAISGGDIGFLRKVKGVGPKMAERLIVELQEPLSKLGLLKDTGASTPAPSQETQDLQDAVAALVGLGYKPNAAEKAVAKAIKKLGSGAHTSELIRASLQEI